MANKIQCRGWTSGIRLRAAGAVLPLAIIVVLVVVATSTAHGQTFTVLYSFTGTGGDGANPSAGLIVDGAGNLYGDTNFGGTSGFGTVFEFVKGTGQETVLHSFGGGPKDGQTPQAVLVRDGSKFYGTAISGGASGSGTAFRMNRAGQEKWVYSFAGVRDGAAPIAGLVEDPAGILYGTTHGGGGSGLGTVFTLTSTTGMEKVIHRFKGGLADGSGCYAGLVRDTAGNLYGTTREGGATNSGTIFRLSPKPTRGWTFRLLYSFAPGFGDGANPMWAMILDSAGNLYGTTVAGGDASNSGIVFEYIKATRRLKVLYSFTGTGGDGKNPDGSLVRDAAGTIYGTTRNGGSSGFGTVFQITRTGTETVLRSFTGPDGQNPSGLVSDAAGNLYGATNSRGASGVGTIYKLTP